MNGALRQDVNYTATIFHRCGGGEQIRPLSRIPQRPRDEISGWTRSDAWYRRRESSFADTQRRPGPILALLACITAAFLYKEKPIMAKVPPFHSIKPYSKNVYHDNDMCTEGNNIERQYRAYGTAGRARCEHCSRLA